MSLELRDIENAGDIERERVVMRATKDVDIGLYAVFRCRVGEKGGPYSGPILDGYWFPMKEIKSGDYVVLYTKTGTTSEKKEEKSTSYFYYWHLAKPIWIPDMIPVLVDTPLWSVGKPIAKRSEFKTG